MIVLQELVKKVNSFIADESLVLGIHKRMPWFLGESREYFIILGIQLNIVLVKIFKEFFGSQNLSDLD